MQRRELVETGLLPAGMPGEGGAAGRLAAPAGSDGGFTLVEMVVMLTIIAVSFLALGFVLTGALEAYASARSRSSFTQVANAEIESMRALDYDDLGVRGTDPDYAAAYPSGAHAGREPVVVTSAAAPTAVTVVSSSPAALPVPYVIRRWVTWTDTAGGTLHAFKRLDVRVEWPNGAATRSVALTSVRYPGGLGSLGAGSNSAPTAVANVTAPSPTRVGDVVSVNAQGSADADADPLTYEWDFGDGSPHVVGPSSTTHIYSLAGSYTIQLTVSDSRGGVGTALHNLTVVSTVMNQPPTASFTRDPASGGVGPLTVNFDAAASTDPDGTSDIASYAWNWGDGSPNGTGINASHTFTVVASSVDYAVTLTVTDKGGLTATSSHTVTVTPLECAVSDGYLRNPESNGVRNDVVVDNNNKPSNQSFTFFATTNSACASVSGQLSDNAGTFVVNLGLQTDVSGVRTWKGTGDVGSAPKFSTGINQSGEIRAPRTSGGDAVFTFSFTVH